VDTDKDPYNVKKGLFWVHLGWLITLNDKHWGPVDVSDIEDDPVAQWQRRNYYPLMVVVSIIIPPLICYFGWHDFSGGLKYAVAWRLLIGHHATFLVNSLAHWSGQQPFTTGVSARDNLLLGIFSAGEGHHNFHHRFPSDYRNGLRLPDFDLSKLFIQLCAKLGLAKNLVQTSEREIEQARMLAQGITPKSYEDVNEATVLSVLSWSDYEHLTRTGSCLVSISGRVCDITDFMHSHPGGPATLQDAIGTDVTDLFNEIDHSPYALSLLSSLQMAVLDPKSDQSQSSKKDE
jgi:stearoyl-CoA desaturase (delta-9 desaturase)